jgi:hypothetical protein
VSDPNSAPDDCVDGERLVQAFPAGQFGEHPTDDSHCCNEGANERNGEVEGPSKGVLLVRVGPEPSNGVMPKPQVDGQANDHEGDGSRRG